METPEARERFHSLRKESALQNLAELDQWTADQKAAAAASGEVQYTFDSTKLNKNGTLKRSVAKELLKT